MKRLPQGFRALKLTVWGCLGFKDADRVGDVWGLGVQRERPRIKSGATQDLFAAAGAHFKQWPDNANFGRVRFGLSGMLHSQISRIQSDREREDAL